MESITDVLTRALSSRYRLEHEIGRGGMATVFRAQDLRHDRPVALKVLHPELGAVLGVERFLAEIRVTANLQHPNLLPLFDSGEAEGLLFYVMPLVEGESLRARLDRERQLPVTEAVRLIGGVLDGLALAHAQGIVHRDLKPENILLLHGQPVVADFGIALAVTKAGGQRMTQTGLSLGTPQYMSPEQASGDRVIDGRSDLYSVAAILYEMLAGEPPHTGGTMQAIMAQVLTEKARDVRSLRDTVPVHVALTLEKALSKVPADRFDTAAEFARRLREPSATIVTPVSVAPKERARWLWPLVTTLAVAAAVVAWLVPRAGGAGEGSLQLRRQLTFEGTVTAAALTTDGAWLAYVTGACRANSPCAPELLLREVDGTQSVRLLTWPVIASPKWSPDGTSILFLGIAPDSSSGVFVISRLGGTPRRLPQQAVAATFSADGKIIVLVVGAPGQQQLRRFNAATFESLGESALPAGLALGDIAMDPAGHRIGGTFATADNAGVILLSDKGTVLDTINSSPRASIRWTADGTGLMAMLLGPGIADDLVRFSVNKNQLSRAAPDIILGQLSSAYLGAFDATDRRVIAVVGQTRHEIPFKRLDVPGASWEFVRARSGFLDPSDFSVDGRRVLADATDNRGDNIYEFDLDSGAEKALISLPGTRQFITWSPNGRHVVYQRFDGPSRAILMASASGGAERVVATVTGIPAWLSDTTLVYADGGSIVVIDTLGRRLVRRVVPDSLMGTILLQQVGGVDGERGRIAYWSSRAGGIVVASPGSGQFTVLHRADHEVTPVGWAADGALLYQDQNTASFGKAIRLMRIPASGGAPEMVSDIPRICKRVVVGARGTRATCRVDNTVTDVWLIEPVSRSR